MCGYCETAWDQVMGRLKYHRYNPGYWLSYCRVGGCDPDIWDYLDGKGNVVERPLYSKKLFHRRDASVPWTSHTTRRVPPEELLAKEIERQQALKAQLVDPTEVEWA